MTEYNIVLASCAFEWGTFWSAFGAIFTAIASVAIVLGMRQLQFDAWLKAQELITKDDFIKLRTKIFARLENPDLPWTDTEKEEAKKVCRKMDEVARLVSFLGRKKALDAWDDPFAKAWLVLGPVVKEEQQRWRWPKKWSAFEYFGQEAIKKLTREGRNPQRQT